MKCLNSLMIVSLIQLLLLLIAPQKVSSQSAFDNYNGIPLIIYTEKDGTSITQTELNEMASFPPFGIMVPNMSNSAYSRIQSANLKVIPRQVNLDLSNGIKNYIERFTEAHYTTWEAEGINTTDGDVNLSYNSAYGDIFTNEYGRNGVKTKTTANTPTTLIYGPGYRQNIKYKSIDKDFNINYQLKSSILVQYNPSVQNPQQYENQEDIICTLKVTATEIIDGDSLGNETTVGTPLVIKVKDITKDTWIDESIDYNLASLVQNYLVQTPYMLTSTVNSSVDKAGYIQFKLIWNGLSYLQLYVDKMVVYDNRGQQIKTYNSQQQLSVKDQADDFSSSTVAAWYSLDEPGSIDNYEPYRIVDSLTHAANSNLRLTTSFTTGWNGMYGETEQGSHRYYTYKEFIKRAKPRNIHVNLYNYDYPYKQTIPGWQNNNIAYITNTILPEINKLDANYGYTIQAAGFNDIVDGNTVEILRKPSTTETLYHANLGLLFGAKELWVYAYYSYNQPSPYTGIRLNGMIDINNNKTDLWYLVKNTIAPRLTGSFGQTLKILTQDIQYPYIDVKAGSILNYRFINKMEKSTTVNPSDIFYFDLGFFKDNNDANKKYFMALNRYYSNITNIKYTFNLTTYKNWEVTDFIKNTKSTIIATNNIAVYNDDIPIGDAGFYSLLPVVIYGGTLMSSETISGINDLKAPMTIASGCTLTVNGTYNVYGNITVNPGSTLILTENAIVNLKSGVRLNNYGTLNASGATFQGNGSAGYWNSISYYANSSGSVQSCTIRDAQCGIYAATNASVSVLDNTISNNSVYGISLNNSSDNTISGCTIQNNGTGINIYSVNTTITGNSILNNTNYGINAEDVGAIYWEDNSIEGNGHGVVLENADPYFFNNIIANNGHGISVISSSPYFGGPNEYGLNAITCSAVPLFRASSYSDVYMGYGGDGGYNSIFGSEFPDMEAYTNSEISADYNYWASTTPATSADATSVIYASNPLSSDPTSGPSCLSKKSSSYAESEIFNSSEQDNDYWKGKEYLKNGDVSSAKNSFKALIDGKYDDKYSPLALLSLYNLKKHYAENDNSINEDFSKTLKDIYETENNSLKPFAIRILCKEAALYDDVARVISLSKELIEKYPNSDHEISALYKLVTYFISTDNIKEAKKYYDQLKSKYPAEDLTKFAGINMGEKNYMDDNPKKNADESSKIQEEFLVEVFPNPFNPTTTIKYNLPVSSNVELKIYDIMGREIKTLVSGYNQTGYKEVIWDGKNENGSQVSSGIYLYRLVAKSLEDGKVFEKSAKMILIK